MSISALRRHERFGHGDDCACWHPGIPDDPTAPQKMSRAGITSNTWPYGPNIALDSRIALLNWTEETGLRMADPRRLCLHWITGQTRRCGALRSYQHAGMVYEQEGSVLDHPTAWTRDGKPALLLAQPYHPPSQDWIDRIQRQWPVTIRIEDNSPWYGHATCGIFIEPRTGLTVSDLCECPDHRTDARTDFYGYHQFVRDERDARDGSTEWRWACGDHCRSRGRWQSQSRCATYFAWLKHAGGR